MEADSTAASVTDYPYHRDHPDQFLRLHLPSGAIAGGPKLPIAVVIHGGFWKNCYNVENAAHTTLAPDLAAPLRSSKKSYAAVEVEYRRRDHEGGGFPGSMDDVARCLGFLPSLVEDHDLPLDTERIVLIGHSAGGQLALWLADHAARASTKGEGRKHPLPVPRLVVGVAPVTDMVAAFERKLSDEGDAALKFMKCSPETVEGAAKYHEASPKHRLPSRVPAVIVAGLKDRDVPEDMIREYCLAAAACAGGASVSMLTFGDADHYALMDAGSDAWRIIRCEIDAAVSSRD